MVISYEKNLRGQRGITLIALVITIVVLLILAGVTIATLTGENGILNKTGEAKNVSEIGTEKEQIALAMVNMEFESENDSLKREAIFHKYLDEYTGEGKTKVYATESSYTIHFLETNRVYTIDENGNIKEENPDILKEDTVAGAFEGTGTEEDPYIIMSIEDLVWLANQVNSGTNTYSNKWIALGKPLDFKSKLSYKNVETTYSYDESSTSYIPDEISETTLMELCTTGIGFIPIGLEGHAFAGNFDGKNYTISNLYENRSGYAGFFGNVLQFKTSYVKNITIEGKITSTDGIVGGLIGNIKSAYNREISNCIIDVEVTGKTSGGIVGYERYTNLFIKNCTNKNKIIGTETAGGVIGYEYDNVTITNCTNSGEIDASIAGGIMGIAHAYSICINGCYNNSIVKGTEAGGIVGYLYIAGLNIYNCEVSSDSQIIGTSHSGGILGLHRNYGTNYIYNSYVLGTITGNNCVGGINGNTFTRSQESGIRVKIENSYFGGTIENGKYTGGLIGYNGCDSLEKMSFKNCYYINTVDKAISNVDEADLTGVCALTEKDMKIDNTLLGYLLSYTNSEIELLPWVKKTNKYPEFNN